MREKLKAITITAALAVFGLAAALYTPPENTAKAAIDPFQYSPEDLFYYITDAFDAGQVNCGLDFYCQQVNYWQAIATINEAWDAVQDLYDEACPGDPSCFILGLYWGSLIQAENWVNEHY